MDWVDCAYYINELLTVKESWYYDFDTNSIHKFDTIRNDCDTLYHHGIPYDIKRQDIYIKVEDINNHKRSIERNDKINSILE